MTINPHDDLTLTDDLFKLEGAKPVMGTDIVMTTMTGITERSMVMGAAVTPITQVNGVPIGRAVGTLLMVYVAQLRLPEDTIRRGYDPNTDETFDTLRISIEQTDRCNLDPLLCEVTDEMIDVEGIARPIVLVRSGTRRYHVLTQIGASEALIRVLPRDADARIVTLISLIANEMREPLPVLDQADIIAMMIDEYGLKQQVIAQHAGYSQSKVSRLWTISKQPPLIKTYVSNESIDFATVEALNKRFKEDVPQRELAARYIVQEGGSIGVNDLANQIAPPPGIAVTGRLEMRGDLVHLLPMGLAASKNSALRLVSDRKDKLEEPIQYWKRGAPIKADPTRILKQHHAVIVQGTFEAPTIGVKSLHITQLLKMIKGSEMVDMAAFEEAVLSDLQAIQEGIEAMPPPAESTEDAEGVIVDAVAN